MTTPTTPTRRCAICGQPIHWAGTVDPGWAHDRHADMRHPTIHAALPAGGESR